MSKKERYYVIESQSRFHLKLEEVDNLEDVVGDFYTAEEVREMLGLEEGAYISTYCAMVKKQLVIDTLMGYIAQMKEKNKRSIIIEDDLVECLKSARDAASDYVEGLRRVGNRLSYTAPDQTKKSVKANKRHVSDLIYAGCRAYSSKMGFEIDIKYAYKDWVGAINTVKKLLTLEELKAWLTKCDSTYYDNLSLVVDQIWEHPEQFAPAKKEEAVDQN